MFTILFLLLLFGAGAVFLAGIKRRSTSRMILGIVLLLLVMVFFRFLNFWGEKLWFDSLGYTQRFWVLELAQYGFAAAGFLFSALLLWLLLLGISRERSWVRYLAIFIGALFGMIWGMGNWSVLLLFMNQVDTAIVDPIFGMPTSFYFFSLPFFNAIVQLLLALLIIAIIASLLSIFVDPALWRNLTNPSRWRTFSWNEDAIAGFIDPAHYTPLFVSSGIFLFVLAASKYMDRFELLFSSGGVVYGPGWTDVNVRLPMMWLVIGVCILAGIIVLIPGIRNGLRYWLSSRWGWLSGKPILILAAIAGFVAAVWFVSLAVIPGLFQNFKVKPNEITLEQPFIINNIQFTREGFNLNKIKAQEYPVVDRFTAETVAQNKGIFSNIRLWDYRALDEVYKQFQEFRLYYEFKDIDVDRYRYNNGQYNQVMVAAREMNINNLPQQSQTFVNRRFKYTHGFGVVMNNVSEFTPSGLPDLLVNNIPPASQFPELKVTEPRIYYGEDTDEWVMVNSSEEEFDYPSGDNNVYNHYDGKGGVQMNNYWRQFLFAYKFNETKLLFSGYPRPESRIMFNRSIRERVQRLAPFLQLDADPYIVLSEGKLYWMIDAYTVSNNYPYSQPYATIEQAILQQERVETTQRVRSSLRGVNYIRNSVKVVVDAYEGSVDFYMFDKEDPLIQAWNGVVPGLLKPWEQMPKPLLEHIRYPVDMLLIQGMVYAKYHMNDPTVFYNQEDLWVRATEKYFDRVQPVEPYYIMWQRPKEDLSFVLMMPFTPKNRQVLVGWLAGMSDPKHYGELLAYTFPKNKLVIGPQQVETKIDQDPNLSSQLSLWDQRGSNVIRGNMLAIPVNETIFYVEPIYLQAETAAYPELRLVVVMHNEKMAYAPTFQAALQKLLLETGGGTLAAENADSPAEGGNTANRTTADAARDTLTTPTDPAMQERIRAANQAFDDYLRYTGDKNFQQASEALIRLEENLKALERQRNQ